MSRERPLEFGIAIPQTFRKAQVDVPALQAFMTRAEALGYESLWTQEQILGASGSLEPVSLLTYAAARTRTVRLGVAVLITPLRNPVQLAKSLSTLDQLSGGRLTVGVGLGGATDVYPAFGLTPERRVRRFTEGLEVMKRLWTEERVTFKGQFWTLEGVAMAPKPVQRPHPPIWFGARHPDALRRAVALGDGFIGAGSSSTADFVRQVGLIRRYLEEAGRDPASFRLAKRVYLAVTRDKDGTMTRLREWFGWYYRNAALADQVTVVGTVDECAAALREIRAAGAELLLLNFVEGEAEQAEQAAREIRPKVQP